MTWRGRDIASLWHPASDEEGEIGLDRARAKQAVFGFAQRREQMIVLRMAGSKIRDHPEEQGVQEPSSVRALPFGCEKAPRERQNLLAPHGLRGIFPLHLVAAQALAAPEQPTGQVVDPQPVGKDSEVSIDEIHALVVVLKAVGADVLVEEEFSSRAQSGLDSPVEPFEVRNVVKNVVRENGVERAVERLVLVIHHPILDRRLPAFLRSGPGSRYGVGREITGDDRTKSPALREGPFEPAGTAAEDQCTVERR